MLDAPDAAVVKISAKCTMALACAGAVPKLSMTVVAVTPMPCRAPRLSVGGATPRRRRATRTRPRAAPVGSVSHGGARKCPQNGSTPKPGIASRTSPGNSSHCRPSTRNSSSAVPISKTHTIGGKGVAKAPMASEMPAMAKARASRFLENLISVLVGCLLGSIRGRVIWLSNLVANCQPFSLGKIAGGLIV